MSIGDPNHEAGPNVPNRTGPGLGSGGSRPPKPSDSYGSVSENGEDGFSQLADPVGMDADDQY